MRKLTILLTLLTLSAELWAQAQSVFYYTATEKLESQFNNLGTVISHEFDVNTNTGTVHHLVRKFNRDSTYGTPLVLSMILQTYLQNT